MLADQLLYTALNITDITDLLSSYDSGKALFSEKLLPTDLPNGSESINFYLTSPFNAALNYGDYEYTVNCRSNNFFISKEIAVAVKKEINRTHYINSFMIVSILPTIQPEDETDNYNTPVVVTIKTK